MTHQPTNPLARRFSATAALLLFLGLLLSGSVANGGVLDPRLQYLLHVREQLGRGTPGDLLRGWDEPDGAVPGRLLQNHALPMTGIVASALRARSCRASATALELAAAERLPGSVRFSGHPSRATLRDLVSLGVEFSDFGHGPEGSRTVYPARIPWQSLTDVAAHPAVLQISPAWRMGPGPPLANSRPQVQADPVWDLEDCQGLPITGHGTLVADFDTGVNYFHPSLFFADGDTVGWIDVDQSGGLSEGDVVDLDGNQQADPGEALRYFEGSGSENYGNVVGVYDTGFDWLYNDENDNGTRNYGAEFGEAQPGYGELLFITLDTDQNGHLDPGEELVTLKTSKIRAIRGRDGIIHERGVDLLEAELDYWGHGTPVSGIVCGGWAGINRMSGIAPGAEMIHAINDYIDEPPFLVPIEEHLAWAATYDPDVFLIEDGEWVWEYMDGSSNVETMLNEYAADQGIIQIIPAGNLATGNMHTLICADQPVILHMSEYPEICWLNLLWLEPTSVDVTLTVPGGQSDLLGLDGSTQTIGNYEVYSDFSVSTRGTRRVDVRIEHEIPGTSLGGDYRFDLTAQPPPHFNLHGFFCDNVSGWMSASNWDEVVPRFTVTWPATADSAVSIAAYDPDGDGDINSYSGWGPRIDGRPDVDIAGPGSTVYSIHPFCPGAYTAFGGTSASGPHAAGAAALLRQAIMDLGSGTFRMLIHEGAQVDQYTTDPDRWGAGKLRILDALLFWAAVEENRPLGPAGLTILSASPNPAAARMQVRFHTPLPGAVDLRVLDILGRTLLRRRLFAGAAGGQAFSWDGLDGRGRRLPTGVYHMHIHQGNAQAGVRVVLVR